MKRKNMISMVTSLALVGVVAVGGTLALLSSTTNNLTNTFTVGQGYDKDGTDFWLDEAKVKQAAAESDLAEGVTIGDFIETSEARVSTKDGNVTQTYVGNLIADAKIAKDPQFHIADDCDVETSWIVAVVSGFNTGDGTTLKFIDVTDESKSGKWLKVTKDAEGYVYSDVTTENMDNGVYIYNTGLKKGEATADLFQQLQVKEFKEGKKPSDIVITGYAVEGVEGVAFADMCDDVMDQLNLFS